MGGVGGVIRTGVKKCRVVNVLAQTMNEQCLHKRSPTPLHKRSLTPYSLFSRDTFRASIERDCKLQILLAFTLTDFLPQRST